MAIDESNGFLSYSVDIEPVDGLRKRLTDAIAEAKRNPREVQTT